jgi:hypothetical protein
MYTAYDQQKRFHYKRYLLSTEMTRIVDGTFGAGVLLPRGIDIEITLLAIEIVHKLERKN